MILIPQHPGSGVGDQLFCYLAGRITAERLGVPFALFGKPKWDSFIKADKGYENVRTPFHVEMPAGKIVIENDFPIYEGQKWFDPEFAFIEDNTIVDGCKCQDERYWEAYPVAEWLKTEPVVVPDDLCIVGFRGNEFAAIPELFLPKSYYVEAMAIIRESNPDVRFHVVTDDPDTAHACFPHLSVSHEIGNDWKSTRYAKYLIVPNSAFYILPALMNTNLKHKVVAPRFWARRNTGEWSTVQNYYKNFLYI